MTPSQEQIFVDQCLAKKKIALYAAAIDAGVAAISAAGTGALSYSARQNYLEGSVAAAGAVVGAAITSVNASDAYQLLQNYLSLNEIKTLVIEQQSGHLGLMTKEIEQIAMENQLDGNKMMAVANAAAIRGEICKQSIADAPKNDLKTLARDQIAERTAANKAKELAEDQARQEERIAEERAQAEVDKARLEVQLNQVLNQVNK